jgi:hypothetical protein
MLEACTAHLRSRHELNREYVGEIARATGLLMVELPWLAEGVRGRDDLRVLAGHLLGEPGAAP